MRSPALLLALFALAACEPPPVYPTKDRRQNTLSSRIEGEVVVQSRARGNAVVLLYDAARPPPPQGTGRPLSFTVVPEAQLFEGAVEGSSGPFTAPYAFSLVAPGNYLVRGFIDHAAPDFIPWYGVTGEPNGGDVGGGAVDPVTRAPRVVVIPEDTLAPATGVTVSFSDTATLPADRPAFAVSGGSGFDPALGPKVFELTPLPIDEGVVHQARPVFFARYIDDNLDGVPDTDKLGAPLFWPKVVVRKLANHPSRLLDENDLNKDGVLDATGEDYSHVDPATGTGLAADEKPDAVVLAAGFVPDAVVAALTDGSGNPRLTPVPMPKLDLVVKPRAYDLSSPAAPGVLAGVPSGRYAVVVLQFTGQSWRVPNELSPALAGGLGLPELESQAFVIEVP
ncbi:MAG: hypothetical protein ACYC8T_04230 [Myxococcaceae bacterium]